jgi:membrane protein DedA with SNARE-associated domain
MLEELIVAPGAWTHLGLVIVAFLDTLPGIGFFVYGEFAFVGAGAILGSGGTIIPIVAVLIAAWLGDMAGFILGQRLGPKSLPRFLKPLKRRRAMRWAKRSINRHGAWFVVLSRLLGPVAWITPFVAGSLGMSRLSFGAAAGLGVLLGGGQFILLGALGATFFDPIWTFIMAHWGVIALGIMGLGLAFMIWRWVRGPVLRMALITGAILTLLVSVNLIYFFASNAHAMPAATPAQSEVCHMPRLVRPGDTDMHLPQPVNVIWVGTTPPDQVMGQLGWQQNMTFSRDRIGIFDFIRLIRQGTPPVSELYLNGQPAQSAHQMPGTLRERLHIRWWPVGQLNGEPVHFGAISQDAEFAIKYYRAIPAIIHDIDRDVDQARDELRDQVEAQLGLETALMPLQIPGEFEDFYTNGQVLVMGNTGAMTECLTGTGV